VSFLQPNQPLPSWAKTHYDKLKRTLESDPRPKGGEDTFPSQTVHPDRAFDRLSLEQETFRHYQGLDENPEIDRQLGERGKVKTDRGESVEFKGTDKNGTMFINRDNSVGGFQIEGGKLHHFQIVKDGLVRGGTIDLGNRNGSREVEVTLNRGNLRPDLQESEHASSTASGVELLSQIPENTEERLLTDIFLTGKKSMTEARGELLSDFKKQTGSLSSEKVKGLLAEPNANTPRLLHQELSRLRQADPENKRLEKLVEKAGTWQVLEDFSKLQADGLTRTSEHYVAPQTLNLMTAGRGWDFDKKSGLPIADSVIVGGGPGGLSTGYHLSEKGKRTLIFEGGNVGQAFSDANAKSVHQLRTDDDATDLLYTANHNSFGVDVSLQRQGYFSQQKSLKARSEWYDVQGEEVHGVSNNQVTSTNALSRSQLFDHMSQIAHGLATRYPDTFVCEKSPVTSVEKVRRGDDTLMKVTTGKGHQVLTRSLVMATGFVGGHGEHARSVQAFSDLETSTGGQVTTLNSDHDLVAKNDKIKDSSIVFSDRMIGRPEIREKIKNLPSGARVAVVGGGESAGKGALELLYTNPGVKVDVYTSKPLEPYQTQVPANVINQAVAEGAIKDPALAKKTLEELKDFGTPITPDTLRELLEMESAGRVRIREMGKRFNAETVDVTHEEGQFQFRLKDQDVKNSLREQRDDWTKAGLYGADIADESPTDLPGAAMVMMACGYDTKSVKGGPLIQQLGEQGLLEMNDGMPVLSEDGMTSRSHPLVAFNTAGMATQGGDTTLLGRAVRAYRLAESLDQGLPERDEPETRIKKGMEWGLTDTNNEEELFPSDVDLARQTVENEGYSDSTLSFFQERIDEAATPEEKIRAENNVRGRRQFPGLNRNLRGLAARAREFPDSLTPEENLLLKRAFQISERTHGEH